MLLKKIMEHKDSIDKNENELRKKVSNLSKDKRKQFYNRIEKKLLDPDDYAVINYVLFLGGFHNLYIREYLTFLFEFVLFLIGYGLLFSGNEAGFLIIIPLYLMELPDLFFSQKIVQIKNYEMSKDIYEDIVKNDKPNNEHTITNI